MYANSSSKQDVYESECKLEHRCFTSHVLPNHLKCYNSILVLSILSRWSVSLIILEFLMKLVVVKKEQQHKTRRSDNATSEECNLTQSESWYLTLIPFEHFLSLIFITISKEYGKYFFDVHLKLLEISFLGEVFIFKPNI
jgi:hypothetical protein